MNKTRVTKDIEKKLLIIERTFDAPKENIWQAYANKELFEKWWGPEGWDTTTKQFDFKAGGRVHYAMKCVDKNQTEWYGKESWGIMDIESINEPTTFTIKDYFSDAEGRINTTLPGSTYTVELVETDGKTNLVVKSYWESAEKLEEVLKMGMIEGTDSQYNKLETLLKIV